MKYICASAKTENAKIEDLETFGLVDVEIGRGLCYSSSIGMNCEWMSFHVASYDIRSVLPTSWR